MTKKKKKARARKKKPAKKKDGVEISDVKITPHPTAGPKVKEFEDQLDAQLAGGSGP